MWTTLTEMAELLLPYITSTRRGIHRCHIVCTWTADCIAFVYVEFEVNSFCHSIDRNGPKFYTTLFLFLFSFPKYNVCYGQVIYQMWGICCSVPLEECDRLLLANMYHDLGLMFYCAPLSVCLSVCHVGWLDTWQIHVQLHAKWVTHIGDVIPSQSLSWLVSTKLKQHAT